MKKFHFILIAGVALLASCQMSKVLVTDGSLKGAETAVRLIPPDQHMMASARSNDTGEAREALNIQEEWTLDMAWDSYLQPDTTIEKEDTTVAIEDSTEVEPMLQPMVLTGAGLTLAAIGTAVVVAFTGPAVLFFLPLALLAGGAAFTTLGYKKIKIEPEKYKGEKFALGVYYAYVVIGLALMLIPVWLLFRA